ncbi:MAG: hypothetical protein AAF485_18065, partial [Chloroflexota bacterium]
MHGSRFLPQQLSGRLILIATLSGLIYLFVFTGRFPLQVYYETIPPVDYTKLTSYALDDLFIYIAAIIGLFWLYLGAINLT